MGVGYRIAGIKIKLDPTLYGNFLRAPDGVLPRYMMTRATVVQLAGIRDCPKDTMKMSESIIKRGYPALNGGYAVSIIAATYYAFWVHDGTQAHGPKNATVLHWIAKDGSNVFVKWVRGISPHPFLRDNLPLFFAGE
jgi:hypothetical protein